MRHALLLLALGGCAAAGTTRNIKTTNTAAGPMALPVTARPTRARTKLTTNAANSAATSAPRSLRSG